MLQNESIEKALQEYQKDTSNIESLSNFFIAIADRSRADAGFIVSVESNSIPARAEFLEIYTGDTEHDLMFVENDMKQKMVMVFTSIEKYQKCSDTSGIIMLMKDLLYTVITLVKLDGIVINLADENVVLDKVALGMLL